MKDNFRKVEPAEAHRKANDIDEIREKLITSFTWMDTKEGHAYWSKVYDKLARVSKNKRRSITEGDRDEYIHGG